MSGPLIILIVVLLNIPLYILIGKLLFGSWGDFWDAIVFWIKPDLWSLLDGEYWDDTWAEIKLGFFVILCGACIYGELWLIVLLFGESSAG